MWRLLCGDKFSTSLEKCQGVHFMDHVIRVCLVLLEMAKLSFSFLIYLLFIYFLAALGLHCCARAFSSCVKRGLLFIAVRGLLIVVASLVAEHGL